MPIRPLAYLLALSLPLALLAPGPALGHEADQGVAAPRAAGILFVAMGPSDNFAMIDTGTNKVMRAVVGPINPHGLAVTPDGKRVYLTSRKAHDGARAEGVTVVSVDARKVVATIDVGGDSHHAWMSPDGRQVYVSVPAENGIAVIDTTTNAVIKTVETGYMANSVATSPDGKAIYVVNKGDDNLAVIDRTTLEVTQRLPLGKGPDHLAVSPDGRHLYVTAAYANELLAVRTNPLGITARAQMGKGPHGVAVSGDGQRVFAASRGDSLFAEFSAPDLERVHQQPLGQGLGHVQAAPGLPYVYINDEVESRIYVYDPVHRKVVDTIHLWPEPHETNIFVPSR